MKSKSGFTIVELLIVVVVVAILASITVVAFNGIQQKARDSRRDAAVAAIKKGLEMYKTDNGQYPYACSNDPNLDCPIASLVSSVQPQYLSTMPIIENKAGAEQSMYYAQANQYTILVPYESKPMCKAGVNVRTDYKSQYAICS